MGERKLFQSIFLTLIAYGFVSFFQSGVFLVPLPAFELVILGIAIYFGTKHFKKDKVVSILFILYGIFQFFGRLYNYNFFMSDESMQELSQNLVVDFIYLLSGILLGLLFFIQNNIALSTPRKLLLSAALFAGIAMPYQWFLILPLLAITALYIKKDILFQNHHSFWLYLLVFTASRELTLNLL